ncbi:hypothetical protein [Roseibium sp.]|uniref:hypothetical protein n=1 Tax=Roseibium sp. TaxID=1936156 RepID=UPI003A96BCFF
METRSSDVDRERSDGLRQSNGEWVVRVQRALSDLDMPCGCKEKLDQTIVAIDDWEGRRLRRHLVNRVTEDYTQLETGIAFLEDLSRLQHDPLSPEILRDHAESLKFLADIADRCARAVSSLAYETDKQPP